MSDALAPCPFCGGPVTIASRTLHGGSCWVAYCRNSECDVAPASDHHMTEAAAIAAWLASDEVVERVGVEIVDELTNRKGLRHAFDRCDEEMQRDIHDTLACAAIRAAVAP